ncbi:winged helix-turn-helix domain-containing protein [Bradyrhizobium genosp. P]|uniref:winged helix-turn-helix domain-containing protein n=1 Tax=Bradyrhizobium genosp. P TaxID=83641 RepID=UPI003CF5FCB3
MDQTIPVTVEGHNREPGSAPSASVFEAAAPRGSGKNTAISFAGVSEHDRAICFGPFRLFTTQRLLLEGFKAVRIGSRALDILIALTRHPGQLVTNCELRELIWPNTFVVEANLTVNVAALRRVLGDGQGGNRYIVNVPGRGYYFVAPVALEDAVTTPTRQHPTIILQQSLSSDFKGAGDQASEIGKAMPPNFRILDIVESGDGGKTVVVVAVAEESRPAYAYARTN